LRATPVGILSPNDSPISWFAAPLISLKPHRPSSPLPSRGPSLGTRLLLLGGLALVLMVLDHREGHLQTIRNTLSVAVHPIRLLVALPFSAYEWLGTTLGDRSTLLRENARLKEERRDASVRLQRFEAVQAENTRLRAMMGSSKKVADRIIVAEILSVDLDPYRHLIVLDRGTRAGAFQGQALLDANGIVGQITRAQPLSSEAILISDPGHATPVEVNRNGLRTIAVGTGDIDRLSLPFLANNADIQEGDLLVSSGLGGAFPSGYPVAEVTAVKRNPGQPFAEISARPAAALNRNRELLLVWFGQGETDSAAPGTVESQAEARP